MEDRENLPRNLPRNLSQDSNSLSEQSITDTDEILYTGTDSETIFNLRREPHGNQLLTKPPQPNSSTTSSNSSLLMITVLLLGVTAAVLLAMWVTTDKECSKDMVKKQGVIDLLNFELKQRKKEGVKASQCEEELKNLTQKHEDLRVKIAWMEAKLDASIKEMYETKEALAKIKEERNWQVIKKLDEILKGMEKQNETPAKRKDKVEKTHETFTNNKIKEDEPEE